MGVSLTLKPMEPAAFVPTLLNRSYQDLALIIGAAGELHPAALLSTLYSPKSNNSGFEDDAYTQLVDQLVATTDTSKLSQLYRELNDYWLDQSWVIPVTQSPQKVAARANVHGPRYDGHDALVLSETWLS